MQLTIGNRLFDRSLAAARCFAAGAAAVVLLLPGIARADLKIVATINAQNSADAQDGKTTAADAAGDTKQVTIFSSGNRARVDVGGGNSTIIDGTTGSVDVIKPESNSYYKVALKNWQPAISTKMGMDPRLIANGNIDSKIELSGTDDNPGNSQIVVGCNTRKFLVDGTLTVSPKHRSFGGRGGANGGGWGGHRSGVWPMFYAPDSGKALRQTVQWNGGGTSSHSHTYEIGGEVWLTEDIAFPTDKKNTIWAQAIVDAMDVGPIAGQLAADIAKQHAIPMYVRLTFSANDPDTGAQTTSTFVMTVQSETVATFDSSLYEVPKSYTEVSPPPPSPAPETPDDNNDQEGGYGGGRGGSRGGWDGIGM